MRSNKYFFAIFLSVGFIISAPLILPANSTVFAQAGNRIDGSVYGYGRRPIPDLYVELNDDLNRTIARTKTSNSGAFTFAGMPSGTYIVRVLTSGTDYEEREERVEIFNLTPTAFESRQVLLYLKLKQGTTLPNAEVIFGQEVPAEAQQLYEKGIADLASKRDAEGLEALRGAIETFPKYYAALERLGLEYVQIGKPETLQAAELLLNVAVGVNARGFKSWYGLACARHALGNYTEGLAASEKAVELKPTAADAVFLHGRLLRNLKRYSEAEKQLLKAKELFVTVPAHLHWELALIYGNSLKKYAEAARELKLYLKVKPDAANAENVRKLIVDFETKAAKK
ncbi:MAG: carboxypeptidase regulatory-like domain-containing protein [Pyrinomonadaceae bacterium]|nr:carboxypeptidase regulatory-like domain-containing protein [Pyrinomonadaceae bacterium]